jgi:membrane protease YdiL (CAAX protease family)
MLNIIVLHLLPGALAMLLMLLAGALFERVGIFPSVPVLFVFVAPILVLGQLGFLYYKGRQLNGKLSLQGIVLYREEPMRWWKIVGLALPIFAWIALVWFVFKPSLNNYFVTNFFTWMPAYFFDDYFLNNLSEYSQNTLIVLGILFTISITMGGAVEELYFRGYLLPRMDSLGGWAAFVNILLFSLYHFWSPWENLVRLLGLTPWIYTVWRTRNIYLSLIVHMVINAFSGLSLLSLILQLA